MKVKLIRNIEFSDLKFGKTYSIIEVNFIKSNEEEYKISFRVVNENGVPALYDSNIFFIVDSKIDNDFHLVQADDGSKTLTPEAFNYSTFWEEFFDSEEKALEIFRNRFPEYKDVID